MGAARTIFRFAPPLLAVGLLLGMRFGDQLSVDPAVADGFHAKAKAAVESIPNRLSVPSSNASGVMNIWEGVDEPLPTGARDLLKPNAYVSRTYSKVSNGSGEESYPFQLIVVQCRDARMIVGHYPPNCYPASGYGIDAGRSRSATIAGRPVEMREYTISRTDDKGRTRYFYVMNFFLLPDGRTAPDMDAVTKFAADYRKLSYGAAQIQVVFSMNMRTAEREAVFNALMRANEGAIAALRAGGIQ